VLAETNRPGGPVGFLSLEKNEFLDSHSRFATSGNAVKNSRNRIRQNSVQTQSFD
jgi:hypothetical protein